MVHCFQRSEFRCGSCSKNKGGGLGGSPVPSVVRPSSVRLGAWSYEISRAKDSPSSVSPEPESASRTKPSRERNGRKARQLRNTGLLSIDVSIKKKNILFAALFVDFDFELGDFECDGFCFSDSEFYGTFIIK